MINVSNATPQNNEDDLMAGLPAEGEMTGGPVMPPNMPHFDHDPQSMPTVAPTQPGTPEGIEAYLLTVIQEQRRRIAELTENREKQKSERPIAGPMTKKEYERKQRDALALADSTTEVIPMTLPKGVRQIDKAA